MKNAVNNKNYWRKLDDQAKVFALASSNKYSSIFRLSVILNEKIEPEILQEALELTLEKYKAFKVRMKKGLFWHYFEENEEKPIVTIEKEYPFKKVNTEKNNDYLFKVTYFENKINIDFFHALTDGIGGGKFLKEIVYRYLELKHPDKLEILKLDEKQMLQDSENAYVKTYAKHTKKGSNSPKAYMIKGEELPKGEIGINHFSINLKELKNSAKMKECSISIYLIAMMIYAIYEGNYKINKGRRPINICVPINLNKYFKSETISNFFSHMVVTLKLNNNQRYSFDYILNMVRKEFENKMKFEKIVATTSSAVGKTKNVFIRIVPLYIKKFLVRLGSLELKRHFTMTFSNIGKFEIDSKYKKYIENFFIILSPDWAEKMKCGVCSYGESIVVTFGTVVKDNLIENRFKELLKENNINFKIQGNELKTISY